MEKLITFTVPAGLQRTEMIMELNQRIKATGKNVHIQAYDTVQGLPWNGGRLMFNSDFIKDAQSPWHTVLTMKQVDLALERAKAMNQAGISFNLVFNSTLESIDLEDEVGNYLLHHLHDEMNGVTIASRALKQYISANYPKYAVTASICHVFNETEQYIRACREYDKVVVLPKFAYEMDRLEGLPIEKLVFIVNDQCFLLCLRKDHYDAISRCYLGGNSTCLEQQRNVSYGDCMMKNPKYRERVFNENKRMDFEFASRAERAMIAQRKQDGLGPKDMEYDFNITPTTRKDLIRRGICNFKLQGRDYNEADYQKKVIGFLEMMVRDEL